MFYLTARLGRADWNHSRYTDEPSGELIIKLLTRSISHTYT